MPAELAAEWKTCTGNPGVDWDQQIESCTRLINSGKETQENVGIAYFNRGIAYEEKSNYPLANSDYSAALAINPKDADALAFRGLNKQRLGDQDGAEADLAAARRIKPNVLNQVR